MFAFSCLETFVFFMRKIDSGIEYVELSREPPRTEWGINMLIINKNRREDVLSLPPPYSALVHPTAFERNAMAEWTSKYALGPLTLVDPSGRQSQAVSQVIRRSTDRHSARLGNRVASVFDVTSFNCFRLVDV